MWELLAFKVTKKEKMTFARLSDMSVCWNQSPRPEKDNSFYCSCVSSSPPRLKSCVCSRCPASFCQPDPSLLAQTGFLGNSWPISVCLDSGFSELRWLFRSDKYAVVLGAGVGGQGVEKRGADEITSPGSPSSKTTGCKTRHELPRTEA